MRSRWWRRSRSASGDSCVGRRGSRPSCRRLSAWNPQVPVSFRLRALFPSGVIGGKESMVEIKQPIVAEARSIVELVEIDLGVT